MINSCQNAGLLICYLYTARPRAACVYHPMLYK